MNISLEGSVIYASDSSMREANLEAVFVFDLKDGSWTFICVY